MQSSVVAASTGCIRNAVALRDPCALTLSSGAPDALGLLGLLMKEKFQRLRLETKSLKLSQNSATLGTCCLQEVAASWLRSHAANVHGASSASCFPFSPTAICPFWPEVRCTHHVWGVSCCMQQTWAMKADTLNRLQRNDHAMIRWICNVRTKDEVSSDSLLTKLGIQDLEVVLRTSRMRWFGHVERSTGWIAEVCKLNVVAQKRSGRPRKSSDEVLENDRKKARYGFCWPSEPFWVERTPSRKTCQKAQPLVEENRALKWIWWYDEHKGHNFYYLCLLLESLVKEWAMMFFQICFMIMTMTKQIFQNLDVNLQIYLFCNMALLSLARNRLCPATELGICHDMFTYPTEGVKNLVFLSCFSYIMFSSCLSFSYICL